MSKIKMPEPDITPVTLPGEGDVQIITRTRVRRVCDNCGAVATKRLTFCYINGRSNPASSMYRRDDCTYCADAEAFSCEECEPKIERGWRPDGMEWGATFTASERNASMFLQWVEEDATPVDVTAVRREALEEAATICWEMQSRPEFGKDDKDHWLAIAEKRIRNLIEKEES